MSFSLRHPHSSESPVSTSSSSHPERSGLITVSDGVYSFPLLRQRHSRQVDCQSGWILRMSRLPSRFSLWMFLLFSCFMCLLDIIHKYTHTQQTLTSSVFICLVSFLICLQVRSRWRKHVMWFSLIPAIILTWGSALSGATLHYLKFLDAACGNWFARHRMHDEKNLDRERKRNLW